MPIKRCRVGGDPGFKWGDEGKCYTYKSGDEAGREKARRDAAKQGRAIESRKEGAK